MKPRRGLDADGATGFDADAGDLAILQDVDARADRRRVRSPRPPHRGAPCRRAVAAGRPWIGKRALSKSRNGTSARTASRSSSSASTPFSRIALPRRAEGVALGVGMEQVQHAALADHGVVVDVLLQPFPQLQRVFVERHVAGQQIVGADDRGVAPDIARADPALLHHGDIGDAVLAGEIIRGRQDHARRRRRSARRRRASGRAPARPASSPSARPRLGRAGRRWNISSSRSRCSRRGSRRRQRRIICRASTYTCRRPIGTPSGGVVPAISYSHIGNLCMGAAVRFSGDGVGIAESERGRARFADRPAAGRDPAGIGPCRRQGHGSRRRRRARQRGGSRRSGRGTRRRGRRRARPGQGQRWQCRAGQPARRPRRPRAARIAPDRRGPGRKVQPMRLADHRVLGNCQTAANLGR